MRTTFHTEDGSCPGSPTMYNAALTRLFSEAHAPNMVRKLA